MEKIDSDILKGWLGAPDVFIMDLRNQVAWQGSNAKIAGAQRFDPQRVSEWSRDLSKDQRLVLY